MWFHDSETALVRVTYPGAPFGANQAFYRADLRTGSLTELTAFGRFFIPGAFRGALAADDTTLYVVGPLLRGGPNAGGPLDRIIRADLLTGKSETVFAAGPARTLIPGVSLSPDGRTLSFLFYPGGENLDPNKPMLRLARVGVDGTGFRELAGPFFGWGAPSPAVWTGDGHSLLLAPAAENAAARFLRINAETGATEPTGLEVEGLNAFSLSPDGSRVVVSNQTPFMTELRSLDHLQAVIKAHK